MSVLELDRTALVLSRIMALSLTLFFTVLTVRLFGRREFDATRTVHRLRPAAVFATIAGLAPWALVPMAAGTGLWFQVQNGFRGDALEKKAKDYWRKNLASWKEAPVPVIAAADLSLDLTPARRAFRVEGSYDLLNETGKPLARVPITTGFHWTDLAWTLDGEAITPENRAGLCVFTPTRPLAPEARMRLGFRYAGVFPKGISKNGGGTPEFILPSGVVLTSFGPSFVPVIGYLDDVGIDKDNRYEPRVYPDDFYEGVTPAAFGGGRPFPIRLKITIPPEYAVNSVGTLVSDEVTDGRRTTVWQSDHPVNFFNVVAGRWQVRRGDGTRLFYYPGHAWNVDEMGEALDAARRHYSEWFHPFPWKELKLSEFPALAFYAQGFPTNITFSEGIGFLTRSDPKANAAFLVTAHESAHQWWGNILLPGRGPGGDILSEGTSHFSTILLMEQVKGLRARIEFCKRLEERYGDRRQADSERPLVKIDGSREGDETVTYDKGGWVFWMLLNRMGRETALAGMRDFISRFSTGPDHAVLQDFIATLRTHAPDPAAYDNFVKQWFHGVVVPEYRLSEPRREEITGGAWRATVRVRNAGTGEMPVEVAAIAGERFRDDGTPSPDYKESRSTVELDAGGEREVTLACDFKPERLLVDPDALVLQLNRKSALARF